MKRQAAWTVLGVVALLAMLAVDYRRWQPYSTWVLGAALVTLIAILVVGAERFGGQRWIVSGGSVQPSETAKLAVIVYVADWLASKRADIVDIKMGLLPFAMVIGLVCSLIIMQPDFSTAVLVGLVASVMFFTAGADVVQMILSGSAVTGLLTVVMMQAPYRAARIGAYFRGDDAPAADTYQIAQALQSIQRGGLLGVGLGQGQQKHVLPAPHTDAVFAVLGEEMGILGCLAVLVLFAVIIWRGLRIAAGSRDPFASLLAVGITSWIATQALLNIAVVTRLVPFTGIPLPFVSFGGSSLVMCLAGIGLLLNLSCHIDEQRTRIHAPLDLRWGNRRSHLSRAHRARRLLDRP